MKLGFREKEEVGKLEKEVDKLEAKKIALEAKIGDAAQGGDFTKVKDLTKELDKLCYNLEKKTDRWLELAERLEAAGCV